MKKIGIVTIISKNMGNRLQNYALQEIIKSLNAECYTIPLTTNGGKKSSIKLVIKDVLSHFIKRYQSVSWDRFDQSIKWNTHSIKDMTSEEIESFDFFIAGSDQIWNPLFNFNTDREFLVFAEEKQRIAYSASIGLSKLPSKYKSRFKKNLSGIPFISVRENEGADIIKNLIDREVPVVLDPTMLLTCNEWDKIIVNSRIRLNKKYILKYFLGQFNHSYNELIEMHAKRNELLIFDIGEYNNKSGEKLGPIEFLYLIKNSEKIYTDSFHGTVFSILFHKQFVVYDRESEEGCGEMSSRINTLLTTFNLGEHRVAKNCKMDTVDKFIHYSEVDSILEEKRRDSINYLANIIDCK